MRLRRLQFAFASALAAALLYAASAAAVAQTELRGRAAAGPFRITGTVVNASSGKPLDRAVVSLESPGADGHLIVSVQTGEDGAFAFEHLAAGKYALRSSRRGFLTSGYDDHEEFSTAIVTGEGLDSEGLIFKMTPDAVITGTITDEAGDPVRRAHITLYRQTTTSGLGTIERGRQAMTDNFGIYEFARLEPGNYFLSVSGSPWYAVHGQAHGADSGAQATLDVAYALTYYPDTPDADAASPIPLKGGDRIEINMSLHPVAALHLLVRLPDNNGRAFSMPVLEQEGMGGTQYVPVSNDFTRVHDQVELSGIAPGHYQVQLPGTHDSPSRIATLDASSDQEIDATAGTPTVDVSGKIVPADGSPMPNGVTVVLRRNGDRTNSNADEADAGGSFHIHDVAPGDYEVAVQGHGGSLAVTRVAALGTKPEGHMVKIGSQAVSLTVTVADGKFTVSGYARRSGKPAAGAMIVLVPRNPRGNRELFRRDQSDSDGSFEFSNVVPGSYAVVAIEDGWPLEWARAEVIGHYVPQGEAVTVSPGASLTVKLPQPVEIQAR